LAQRVLRLWCSELIPVNAHRLICIPEQREIPEPVHERLEIPRTLILSLFEQGSERGFAPVLYSVLGGQNQDDQGEAVG